MEEAENRELAGVLRGRIRERGRIPFEEFMDLCLYHPRQGYYLSSREKIGPRGDYYTSPHVHAVFGQLLARQFRQMWEILGRPSPFTVAEMGAGQGLLASHILAYCRRHQGDFYPALSYLLAEIGPPPGGEPQARLSPFLAEGKAGWTRPESLLSGERPFTGCLFSNELIDAFPVHLVEPREGKLQEVFVACPGPSFRETLAPPSTPDLEEYLSLYGLPLEEGQRAEVNLRALRWMEGADRAVRRGFVLTIDYGYEAAELYHPARRAGTLLCYYRHTTSEDPYQRVGLQDMTSHVNFTALRKKGESLGWETAGYTEQYRFLASLGLLKEMEDLERSSPRASDPSFLREKLAMRDLLLPAGMGTLFKVLAQSKGVKGAGLLGFRDPFSRPRGGGALSG